MWTASNAPFYGPVIHYQWANGYDNFANTAACIALVDGDASPCAIATQALTACEVAACASCPNINSTTATFAAFETCRLSADTGPCNQYDQAIQCQNAPQYNACFFANFESDFRGLGQIFCAANTLDAGTSLGDAALPADSGGD
jgi:hypothetical protein